MPGTAHVLKINGEWIPGVTSCKNQANDILSSDSKRSDETGVMHYRVLRSKLKKFNVTLTLTDDQIDHITRNLAATQPVEAEILCPAFNSGKYVTGEFMLTNFSSELLVFRDTSYWRVAFALEEI